MPQELGDGSICEMCWRLGAVWGGRGGGVSLLRRLGSVVVGDRRVRRGERWEAPWTAV